MDSTQAASNSLVSSNPLPGSVDNSSLYLDKNGVDDDSNVLNVNASYDRDSVSSVSDDSGFVSGEEDFVMEQSVLAYPGDKVVEIEPFVGSSDSSTTFVGDDVEKSYKDVVLEGGEGFSCENLGSDLNEMVESNVDVVAGMKEDKVTDVSEGLGSGLEETKLESEEGLEVKKNEGLDGEENDSQVVEKHVVDNGESEQVSTGVVNSKEGVEVICEGDYVVETINVDLLKPGVAVVGEMEGNTTSGVSVNDESDQASGEAVEEGSIKDVDVLADSKGLSLNNKSDEVSGGTNGESSVHDSIAPTNSELFELGTVKFTPEGRSVVEDEHINQGVPEVPVAEKGKTEIDGDVSSKNELDQLQGVIVSAVEDGSFGDLGANIVEPSDFADVKTTPIGDSIVENIQTDVLEPGVVVVGIMEKDGQADSCVGNIQEKEKKPVPEVEDNAEAKNNLKNSIDGVEVTTRNLVGADGFDVMFDATDIVTKISTNGEEHKQTDDVFARDQNEVIGNEVSGNSFGNDSAEPNSLQNQKLEVKDDMQFDYNETSADDLEVSGSDGESDGVLFGSSDAAKQFIEELKRGSGGSNSGTESSHDDAQRIDGQIATASEEEETDEEGDGKELFDSAALTALLKAATGAGSDRGNTNDDEPKENLGEEEKRKLEKLQSIRVKFLRLVQRLGMSSDESFAAKVLLDRLARVAGRQTGQLFSLDTAKQTALQLEEVGKEDMDFSLNILVLGKSGVGKSATINTIFGEEKARIDAFQPATTTVKEITGVVDGVKIRVLDTPGLKSSVVEQSFNRSILSSVKKFTKKTPVDIVLYVDRLDTQTRDLNDLPLLRTITSSLGSHIWYSAIVTLTHAASAPPEDPSGSPLSYDVFVTQRSHVLQQYIGQAVGDLRMMHPSLMNPVCQVENQVSCRKSREGQKVLPNGLSWRPELMISCYSMKILSEANSLSKPQNPFDPRKLFGFRTRSPPLPYMLSSMLQSRVYPKISTEQGGDNGDSDMDLADLSDSDQEDEDEYDQLPPFKPLKKSQLAKLSNEQRKAYFEEYDYRVKLLQKKQWREELKRMKEMKSKGKDSTIDYGYNEEDPDAGSPAPVSVPLPDMALPPSFDGDYLAHRYRFLEPTSQFLARPVLDTHGWDHDCGYDGVNLEQSLAVASRFPAIISVQLTKDKKEFTINLDSSIAAKHGENGSSMAGFDIQNMGKQLAYIIRGETKFKNFRKNKTAAGISVTFLGENVVTGLKVEDQISFGKQYSLVASGGTVGSQQDLAFGANIEMQRRELDYPVGQVQSSFGLSIIKWRGDLALGINSLAQFSIGRNSKVAVRAGINNKLSGQISVRTSSSEHLSLALVSILPTAIHIYKKLCPGVEMKHSIY